MRPREGDRAVPLWQFGPRCVRAGAILVGVTVLPACRNKTDPLALMREEADQKADSRDDSREHAMPTRRPGKTMANARNGPAKSSRSVRHDVLNNPLTTCHDTAQS